MQSIHVDIVTVGKPSMGYKYVLSVICRFSKFLILIPLKTQEAHEIANELYDKVFAIFGPPCFLTSDRGRNFLSKIMDYLLESFKIKRIRTSSFHPKSNGVLESCHKTILSILKTTLTNESDWPKLLSSVTMSYNSSIHITSTKYTPYYVVFGREMNNPINNALIQNSNIPVNIKHYVCDLKERLKIVHKIASENIVESKEMMKNKYETLHKVQERNFRTGNLVYLKQEMVPLNAYRKLYRKWSSQPYYITKVLGKNTYILRNLYTDIETKYPVSGDRLKSYYNPIDLRENTNFVVYNNNKENQSNNNSQTLETKDTPVPQITKNGQNKTKHSLPVNNKEKVKKQWFTAKHIIRARTINNEKEYLIKWEGAHYKDSWVLEKDVSPALLRNFYISKSAKIKRHKSKNQPK